MNSRDQNQASIKYQQALDLFNRSNFLAAKTLVAQKRVDEQKKRDDRKKEDAKKQEDEKKQGQPIDRFKNGAYGYVNYNGF